MLDSLASRGLLSDARYREARLRSRMARGQGPLMVRRDWHMAGADALVGDTLLQETDWVKIARLALERRFGTDQPGSRGELARRARFLEGRGFPAAIVQRVLRLSSEEYGTD